MGARCTNRPTIVHCVATTSDTGGSSSTIKMDECGLSAMFISNAPVFLILDGSYLASSLPRNAAAGSRVIAK